MGFSNHGDSEERRHSAISAIKALLAAPNLYPTLRRELISLALGKLTEAEGMSKHRTRYRSQSSIGAPSNCLRHDHVFGKKRMMEALIASPDRADNILGVAVGCTVTKEEHDSLHKLDRESPNSDGWDRYKQLGITVIDMTTWAPVDLESFSNLSDE
jgi:hypothetical protein